MSYNPGRMPVSPTELGGRLGQALSVRHIEEGFALLDQVANALDEFGPEDVGAPQFVLCLAKR